MKGNILNVSGNTGSTREKNVGVLHGVLVNSIGGTVATCAMGQAFPPILKKINKNIPNDKLEILNNTFDCAFEKSGMAKKGVSVLRTDNVKGCSEFLDNACEHAKNGKLVKLIRSFAPDKTSFDNTISSLAKNRMESYINLVKEGKNAFYAPLQKTIILPEKGKGLQLTCFHELGHSLNYLSGKFSNILRKTRQPSILLGLALTIGALTLKSEKNAVDENGEKKKGVRQFIKNNVGIIAAASYLPTILEEGLASLKGQKLAKDALKSAPDLLKKVRLSNLAGFGSYVAMAAATGLVAELAVKVKDKVQKKT